ncbi:hypothetical protein ACIQ7Q_28395 [Streptomyces sp. NPDC096176]|uniref:hypothetical protein n=1 Tax=Streptomyces sp. NPDC096176 TaxID=3366079 RepID=UPI00382C7EAA
MSSIRRKIARRRAAGNPNRVVVPQGSQGSGADHLGQYAPARSGAAHPAQPPSGADFLGAYAPQQRREAD